MPPIRVVVVDDEPLGLQGLSRMVAEQPGFAIVAECADGESAVRAIRKLHPDLVLLDVQMPGLDGFGVVRTIGPEWMPAVIFVTAFDAHAVRAFEVNAIDYLLKPFETARLEVALRRAADELQLKSMHPLRDQLTRLLEHAGGVKVPSAEERLTIHETGRVIFIPVSDVDWIEGASYYARLHVGAKCHLIRETLSSLAARLDPGRFFRTHRSAIVNLSRVREIQPAANQDSIVVLSTGAKVRLAKSRRELLETALAGP
jgi:two-component system LytT family response regulator